MTLRRRADRGRALLLGRTRGGFVGRAGGGGGGGLLRLALEGVLLDQRLELGLLLVVEQGHDLLALAALDRLDLLHRLAVDGGDLGALFVVERRHVAPRLGQADLGRLLLRVLPRRLRRRDGGIAGGRGVRTRVRRCRLGCRRRRGRLVLSRRRRGRRV